MKRREFLKGAGVAGVAAGAAAAGQGDGRPVGVSGREARSGRDARAGAAPRARCSAARCTRTADSTLVAQSAAAYAAATPAMAPFMLSLQFSEVLFLS